MTICPLLFLLCLIDTDAALPSFVYDANLLLLIGLGLIYDKPLCYLDFKVGSALYKL
jgi:hypothetical protein